MSEVDTTLPEEDKKNIHGRYISLAIFKAYNREMSEFWTDDKKPLVEQIELRLLDICHTIIIHEIKIIDTHENFCSCPENIKHGTTSINCCNHCGKPTEEFWKNQK